MLTRCRWARLVDITHEIPPQDVVAGAFILASAAAWFAPGTVFLAVVDPGVGTNRPLIAVRADGRYFVAPDNGLLALTLERARARTAVRLTNQRHWLTPVSRTFHGRDIMAPAAAHLACGGSLSSLGTPIKALHPLALPQLRRNGRTLQGQIVHIDAFGNLITNLPGALLGPTASPRLALRYRHHAARVVSSYAAGRPRELVALVGAAGCVELALPNGSAAHAFRARRGDPITVLPRGGRFS